MKMDLDETPATEVCKTPQLVNGRRESEGGMELIII
jgi:hypothetical protein